MKKEKKLSNSKSVTDHKESKNFAIDITELKKRLEDDNFFLVSIVNTIPPKMYFDQETNQKLIASKHATMDLFAKGLKRSSVENQEITSKVKHKRARLDPNLHKSVSEIQMEMDKSTKKNNKNKKSILFSSASFERAANIEELQKRLQARIKELQEKRRGCSESEFLAKKRLKRKVKRLQQRQKGNLNKAATANDKKNDNVVKSEKMPKKMKPKPVFNKDGKMIYSKFDFSNNSEEKKNKKSFVGKKYKKLLQHAEKEKGKIEHVKEEDSEKANTLVQKKLWQRAIQKAEGVKLKDDPVLLKKSLKREEKKKKKSEKAWKGRIEHTEKMKKMRQEKRTKNIQARKKEKFDRKMKLAKKKGRIIPGF